MATYSEDRDGEQRFIDYRRPAWPYSNWEKVEIESSDDNPSNITDIHADDKADDVIDYVADVRGNDKADTGTDEVADDKIDDKADAHGDEKTDDVAENVTGDKTDDVKDGVADNVADVQGNDNADDVFSEHTYRDVNSEDDVSDTNSLKILLNHINSPDVAETEEAKQTSSSISLMIDKTMKTLTKSYKLFKGCFMLAIGSMAEKSKVYKPDEFDFAIVLPAIADVDVFALLLREESIMSNRSISELVNDTDCTDTNEFIMNFSYALRQMWADEMPRNAADNWEILETTCCLDDVSVAGTFHIKRHKENDIVDLDICFWIPLTADKLSSAPESVTHALYLRTHCLDQNGLVYAILTKDANIAYAINSIRFPMSSLEKQAFQKYGSDNNRIKCYRSCKCLVHHFIPKYKKRNDCSLCFDSLISSFMLKNTVLYLIDAYKADEMWEDGQLVNRIIEVFDILCMCMKVNYYTVSAFFCPYEIRLDDTRCFNPKTGCIESTEYDSEFYGKDPKPCTLPKLQDIIAMTEDPISKQALNDYDQFLRQRSWRGPEVVCRFYELLCVLREEESESREEMVKESGWCLFGLEFRDNTDLGPISVDTKF